VEEGKPTLLEFWAVWCENCEALEPQMEEIQARWRDKVNVVAVAVAVSQSQRRVKRHAEEQGAPYPYLWDGKGEAVRGFQVPGTSVVVILDGEGKVAYTGSGRAQDLVKVVDHPGLVPFVGASLRRRNPGSPGRSRSSNPRTPWDRPG
jgi:thiol-disulfide isomerase/thioredoxin